MFSKYKKIIQMTRKKFISFCEEKMEEKKNEKDFFCFISQLGNTQNSITIK